jgi:hypothetical protein
MSRHETRRWAAALLLGCGLVLPSCGGPSTPAEGAAGGTAAPAPGPAEHVEFAGHRISLAPPPGLVRAEPRPADLAMGVTRQGVTTEHRVPSLQLTYRRAVGVESRPDDFELTVTLYADQVFDRENLAAHKVGMERRRAEAGGDPARLARAPVVDQTRPPLADGTPVEVLRTDELLGFQWQAGAIGVAAISPHLDEAHLRQIVDAVRIQRI